MQSWVNYHSHTHYCDGTNKPVDYIKEAIKHGLPAYGYSSHAPVNFHTDWCIANDKLPEYISEIQNIKNSFRNQIEVYHGLEIDFIPGIAGRSRHLLEDLPLDFFISSVHFVDKFSNGVHWNIDTSYELFAQGLKEIFNNNFRKAATRFYEITRQMIIDEKPDVVGHIDKIKMFNNKGNYFTESEKWYKEQIALTINTLKQQNTIVEINTRGFYRYGQADLYPGKQIIGQLVKADIPIMINSDAHKPEEIISGMPYASKILMDLGVKEIYALQAEKWRPFSFNEEGLYWG